MLVFPHPLRQVAKQRLSVEKGVEQVVNIEQCLIRGCHIFRPVCETNSQLVIGEKLESGKLGIVFWGVRGLAQILISIAAVFFLLGHVFRTVAVAGPPETRWLVMPAPNPDMTYMVQPNGDFVTFGVPFRTNELGFRDGPIAPKSPNMFRILCVGDSVTFGTGVTNEETFPNVLERGLQQSARPGITVDVINAGVSAYNARNIRGQLEQYLSQLRPDVVVYIFVENDLDDSVSAGPQSYLTAWDPTKSLEEPFIGDDFAGMWMIRRQMTKERGLVSRIARLFDNEFEVLCKLPPALILGSHPEPQKRWAKFIIEIERMKNLCTQAGASFLVYSFGMKAHSEPIELKLRGICKERGIPEASTLPVFLYETYADKYSLGGDPHCNPEGHRLMADRLLSFLVESRSLPDRFINPDIQYNRYDDIIDAQLATSLEQQSLSGPAVIDFEKGNGAIGLLGGVDIDGKIGRRFIFRLGGTGNAMEILASGLTGTPDQPLSLLAQVEGIPAGSPVNLTTERVICHFPIPPEFAGITVEVELITQGPLWLPSAAERQQGVIPLAAQIHQIRRVDRGQN